MFDYLNERFFGVVLGKIKLITLKIDKNGQKWTKNSKNRLKSTKITKKRHSAKMGSKNLFLKKIFKNLKKLNEIDVLANFHKNICIFHNSGGFSIF